MAKGRPHGKLPLSRPYNNTLREQRKYFANAKKALQEIRLLEEIAAKPIRIKKKDNSSRARPKHIRRAEAREGLLPVDRVCPECKNIVLKSRQWVIKKQYTICLSCERYRNPPNKKHNGVENE